MEKAKIKIAKLNRYTKDKAGAPLTNKNGKAYTRLMVTDSDGTMYSGFDKPDKTNGWQVGDTVEFYYVKNGNFNNIEFPGEEKIETASQLDRIEKKIDTLLKASGKTVDDDESIPF